MKEGCLRKFVLIESNIIHLTVQLIVAVLIVVKNQSIFPQIMILDFTVIVLKVIIKMLINTFNEIDILYYLIIQGSLDMTSSLCIFEEHLFYFSIIIFM